MYELITEAKKGNKEAFTKLILEIEDDLYKIARTRLNNQEDIFDAIQETMISAYKSIYQLKKPESFKKWIIKILINKCNDQYKNRNFDDLDENYINAIEEQEYNAKIEDSINFNFIMKILNYDERIAMTLHYLENYTTKEISEILKISENTIKTRIRRSKEKIKSEYERGKK